MPAEDLRRRRRAARHRGVDRDDILHASGHAIAAREHAAGLGAIADGDHQPGFGRGFPGLAKRHQHVAGDRARDEQQVGVARRRDEVQAEAFEVVGWAREPANLNLATVAGSGVDLADRDRASEDRAGAFTDLRGEPGVHDGRAGLDGRVVRDRREAFGRDADAEDLREEPHDTRLRSRASSFSMVCVSTRRLLKMARAVIRRSWMSGSLAL